MDGAYFIMLNEVSQCAKGKYLDHKKCMMSVLGWEPKEERRVKDK
jgi:hypothetical protein